MQALAFLGPLGRPFGVDLFCLGKKFLVLNLVSRNLKIKYRRSILGVFWTLASPLAMSAVYYLVFSLILHVTIPHYLVFILTGVLFWGVFAQTVMEGMESIAGNWGLVSKIPIPLQIFPYVGAMTNLTTLLLALPVLWAVAAASGAPVGLHYLMLVPAALWLSLIGYGIGLILAIGMVYLRDLRHSMAIVMQIWFYATPVIYSESMVPERFRFVHTLNPLGTLFIELHRVMVEGHGFGLNSVLTCLAWLFIVLLSATLLLRNFGRGLVEKI